MAQDNNKDNTDKGTKPKKKGCFHGDDVVVTRQHGPAKLADVAKMTNVELLSRDDQGRLAFSPVYYWIHKDDSMRHQFLDLRTESGHRLSITRDHLIYEVSCSGNQANDDLRAIFADRLT
uniref:Hedgehog protein Hint domain-containing protein n=1 Tax=Romanomermis culicivorax TaxID=13658 RepID=A0A915JW49_ROMCU